jgi:hypothetical protein
MNSYTVGKFVLIVFLYFTVPTIALGTLNVLNSGERLTTSGIVIVSKDSEGNLVSVRLMAEDMDGYNIKLDETGVKLGMEMHHKWVEVTGIIYNEGKEYWFEVESYREINEGVT